MTEREALERELERLTKALDDLLEEEVELEEAFESLRRKRRALEIERAQIIAELQHS